MRTILLLALLLPSLAFAVSREDLAREMGARTQRVPEFQFIREEAKKLGVRAYLFGGTAAAYGHYVKWDLDREAGDKTYLPSRFDYDYTNIYRSTQDLDIVIDGSPEKAEKLQQALANAFPHFLGAKGQSAWEVRLLRQSRGDKLAILENPDFLNQHTDSNSTGIVEITETPKGENPVRDVMDWDSHEPNFLKDVRENKLHYYFNPKHGTTKFAKEGRNPPILSVIRYLTKALQFESELRPEDLARVKKIIADFNPKKDTSHEYVRRWLLEKENGRKLVQNALNMEYARRLLDETGLRQKLLEVPGVNPQTVGSLGWWLNKQPLESKPLGTRGKTAAQLGLDVVAHEAGSFEAWESITKSPVGAPNVFISRQNAPGEAAVHGDGFYTKVGREGARGTGNTIRFHLDPDAREGHDFDYLPQERFVVVKNRNALKVIAESLDWDYPKYFSEMLGGEMYDGSNRAQFQKLNRRLKNQRALLLPETLQDLLVDAIRDRFQNGRLPDLHAIESLAREYFLIPIRGQGFEAALSRKIEQLLVPLLTKNLARPGFLGQGDFRRLVAYREAYPQLESSLKMPLYDLAVNHATAADLDDIRTYFSSDVTRLARIHAASTEPPGSIGRSSALMDLAFDDQAAHNQIVTTWLKQGDRVDLANLSWISRRSTSPPAELGRWLRAAANPRTWTPEEAPLFRAFLAANRDQLYELAKYARVPAAITCNAYFASLPSPRSRYARSTLALAGTGATAAYALSSNDQHWDDYRRSYSLRPELAAALDQAATPAAFLAELRKLGLAQPADHLHQAPGERMIRGSVGDVVAHAFPRFRAMHPSSAEIAELAPYVVDVEQRKAIWEALRDAHATPAEMLTADIKRVRLPMDLNGDGRRTEDEWENNLDAFFGGNPSDEQVKELQRRVPCCRVDVTGAQIRWAKDADTALDIFESSGRRFLHKYDVRDRLLKLDLRPDQVERFLRDAGDEKPASLPIRLKYAPNPRELVPDIAAIEVGNTTIGQLLRDDQRPNRITSADLRPALRSCSEFVNCALLLENAVSAARSPEDFILTMNEAQTHPSVAMADALGKTAVYQADRFAALHPTVDDYVRLKQALDAYGGWYDYSREAVKLARDKKQLEYFLTPSTVENTYSLRSEEYKALRLRPRAHFLDR